MALTVVFSGMLAGTPWHGGATWAALQWILGLRRLGHEVWVVEPVTSCAFHDSATQRYFESVTRDFALAGRAALLLDGTRRTAGCSYDALADAAHRADVVVNTAGRLRDRRLLSATAPRIYLDLDPAFTQLWADHDGIDMGFAGHSHFVTVGTAIGTPTCPVPTCGLEWIPMLPPVVLEHWPLATSPPLHGLTTVANWRSYGSVWLDGERLGQKAHAWRNLVELPRLVDLVFEPALAIHPEETADIEALGAYGWHTRDPATVAATPAAYAEFIRGSWAELCVAKSGYTVGRTGWFSDRSACYLASGRPVVASDTAASLPFASGPGYVRFRTAAQAAAGLKEIQADYQTHARAARHLAETHFESDVVLSGLLARIGGEKVAPR